MAYETYWPSPITVRDLLDYGDARTKMFDAREAAQGEVQANQDPSGMVPLQTVLNANWNLVIAVECVEEDCDNVLTPRGMLILDRIDKAIAADPLWHKICLFHSDTNQTCAMDPNPARPLVSIAHPLLLFRLAFGDDVASYTQFGMDFALFGVAQRLDYFNFLLPLFSREFNIKNRKAKMYRMVLQCAGPIAVDGIRYQTMRDRSE